MTVSRFHDVLQYRTWDRRFPDDFAVIERMWKAPKFVFSDDILDWLLAHEGEYADARITTIQAGHTELPHNPMLVEWNSRPGGAARAFWLLEQPVPGVARYRAWGAALLVPERLTIVPDHMFTLDWGVAKEELLASYTGKVPEGWEENKIMRSFEHAAGTAFCFAMALHVRGIVTRPPREVSEKLDRARLKRRLPPITRDYVTVHIGYITDRDGKRHDYHEGLGHHVRIHLRRGHIRNQACGPGREEHREMWIPPVLVNYRPGAQIEDANYLVVP